MKKLTPLLTVEALEGCLPFWTERLGFQVTVTVPHGDRLGFAILQHGEIEVMLQSRASIRDDVPGVADKFAGGGALYVEVEDLGKVERAMSGVEVLVPRRQTFYGMDELFVLAPGGVVVGLAAPTAK